MISHKNKIKSTFHHVLNRQYGSDASSSLQLSKSIFSNSQNFYKRDLKGHYGCVNAIEFSNHGGDLIISGGDDRRVLLWKHEESLNGQPPVSLKAQHFSNIFCLAFDNDNKKVLSGGNDEQVVVHDLETGKPRDVYRYDEAVYCLSVDPLNNNVFASAADDGQVLIYDIRAPASEEPFVLANYEAPMHAVAYNPAEPRLLATANSKQGLCLWDIRKPKCCLLRYGGRLCQQSAMSVRISQDGRRLIALRRRLPPVLYDISTSRPLAQFDHPGYYNSCAMKTCCFAGDRDQYLVSGSDDHNVYIWKIPDDPVQAGWVRCAHTVLNGHRSLVNQVRFNPANQTIISSGVEKVIKLWSPFSLPESPSEVHEKQEDDTEPRQQPSRESGRPMYTHEEYINLVLRSGELMTQDFTSQNQDEDPRMLAFFDSLVQRELEGWSSEDEEEDSEENQHDEMLYQRIAESSITNSSSGSDSEGRSEVYSPFTRAFASVIANQDASDFPSLQELNQAADGERGDASPPAASSSRNGPTLSNGGAVLSTGGLRNSEIDLVLSANAEREPLTSDAEPQALVFNAEPEAHASSPSSPTQLASALAHKRGTVYDLILTKRREYLMGIQKQETKAKIRRQKKKEKLAKIRRRLRDIERATSSSSGGSSDNESLSEEDDSDASPLSNREYHTSVSETLERLIDQRRQRMSLERMGRLRFLRSRLETEDNEEAIAALDGVSGGAQGRNRAGADTVAERRVIRVGLRDMSSDEEGEVVVDGIRVLPEEAGQGGRHQMHAQSILLRDALVLVGHGSEAPAGTDSTARGTETTVTRSQARLDLRESPSSSNAQDATNSTSDNNSHPDSNKNTDRTAQEEHTVIIVHESSYKPNSEAVSTESNGLLSKVCTSNGDIGDKTGGDCSRTCQKRKMENGLESSDCAVASTSSTSQQPEQTREEDNEEGGEETTWRHFKRFKHKVEKARRNYRKRHSQDEDP